MVHRVLGVRRLTPQTFVLRFSREGLDFRAGEHLSLSLPRGAARREYSIYSAEGDPFLEVLVREVEEGALSPRLAALSEGDALEVRGPSGVFVLDPRREADQAYLLVATGTGIAPFHSMVRTHPELRARVVHGVRYPDEAYDREDYPDHALCLSRPDGSEDFPGRVTDWLRVHPVDPGVQVYLCGNAMMIDEVWEILTDQGVDPGRVSSEVYF